MKPLPACIIMLKRLARWIAPKRFPREARAVLGMTPDNQQTRQDRPHENTPAGVATVLQILRLS